MKTRRDFLVASAALLGLSVASPVFGAQQGEKNQKSQESKEGEKPVTEKKIQWGTNVANDRICCGTCQHWSGERRIVAMGRRVQVQAGAFDCKLGVYKKRVALNTPSKTPSPPTACIYKRWVDLP